jgi:hypothetical protein
MERFCLRLNPISPVSVPSLAPVPAIPELYADGLDLVHGARLGATFQNIASNNANIELNVEGSWFDRSATITMGNVVVAQISRKLFKLREIVGGQQTYYVTVAPGVDLALIAALCVCLDEKANEKE